MFNSRLERQSVVAVSEIITVFSAHFKILTHISKPQIPSVCETQHFKYEGWNFNFSNTPLDWIQELLE